MSALVAYLIALVACLIAAWLVPALAMRGLDSALAGSRLVGANYRGRPVYVGLGLVWVVWAVSVSGVSTVFDIVSALRTAPYSGYDMALFEGPLTLGLYGVPLMLVVVSVIFGLADDVFGSHDAKGFRGHVTALVRGTLTTGGLKLLGIGGIAAVYGWHITVSRVSDPASDVLRAFGWWVLATLSIALAANLMNLFDLRPGRALKAYSVLAAIAAPVFALDASSAFAEYSAGLSYAIAGWGGADQVLTSVLMLLVLLGPVAAVWRLDLGERGMLGDAGSNAMGAIVGYLLASSLTLGWLGGVVAVLFALNVLSERVSFSAIIERTPLLRALDGLGRAGKDAGSPDTAGG